MTGPTDYFPAALGIVLDHERGFVDNPADHGGPTNWGLTLDDLRLANLPADVETLKALTREAAADIYRAVFWLPHHFDLIQSRALATVLFDQGTLDGYTRVIEALQTILGLAADGVLGPETAAAINAAEDLYLAHHFLATRAEYYLKIVRNDASQKQFLKGWLNRLFNLINCI